MKASACVKISIMCEEIAVQNADLKLAIALPRIQDDVVDCDDSDARATVQLEADVVIEPKKSDSDAPSSKKRKTRRGKSKRQRNVHPYRNYRKNNGKLLTKMIKAEAPYNSNRFLIEDHGDIESIDEELKKTDQASTSTVTRTRDSSFSMDSDGEFYSTPDDEEVFLIKDFDDQYESLQAERLQGMSKDELIKEYLMLEGKVELLTKRLRTKPLNNAAADPSDLRAKCEVQKEIQRLTIENESLKRENDSLRSKVESSSGSADSETDSSDTCSSSSSSLSRCESPVNHFIRRD